METQVEPQKPVFKLVVTGGGTAGHVWPNFALVEDGHSPLGAAVRDGRVKVSYIGSIAGMERELVEKYAPHWQYVGIQTGKLRRYFSWQNFVDPFRIIIGFLQAFFYLNKIDASVVFSKGGFVSAPVVWAAWLQGIPVVIHESDVTPALATRLTLPFAYRAVTAFSETVEYCSKLFKNRIMPLGLPIRPSLLTGSRSEAVKVFGLDASKKTILVFGGSLGAEGMNKKLAPALEELSHKYNIIHICGKGKTFALNAAPTYKQFEFLKEEMPLAYAAADLAICRSGASSILELAAARVPMILIPLGLHQSRGDQIVNAKIFAKRGWAEWIDQDAITKENMVELVEKFMNEHDARRKALADAPGPEATYKIGSLLLQMMERRGS